MFNLTGDFEVSRKLRNKRKFINKIIIPRVLKNVRRAIHKYRHRHIFKLNRNNKYRFLV